VQVAPIKPTLNAPGTRRLKLKYDQVVSNFAFKFNLRPYTMGAAVAAAWFLANATAAVIHTERYYFRWGRRSPLTV